MPQTKTAPEGAVLLGAGKTQSPAAGWKAPMLAGAFAGAGTLAVLATLAGMAARIETLTEAR